MVSAGAPGPGLASGETWEAEGALKAGVLEPWVGAGALAAVCIPSATGRWKLSPEGQERVAGFDTGTGQAGGVLGLGTGEERPRVSSQRSLGPSRRERASSPSSFSRCSSSPTSPPSSTSPSSWAGEGHRRAPSCLRTERPALFNFESTLRSEQVASQYRHMWRKPTVDPGSAVRSPRGPLTAPSMGLSTFLHTDICAHAQLRARVVLSCE